MRIGEFSASLNKLDIAEESVIWKGNNTYMPHYKLRSKTLKGEFWMQRKRTKILITETFLNFPRETIIKQWRI